MDIFQKNKLNETNETRMRVGFQSIKRHRFRNWNFLSSLEPSRKK